MSDQVEEDKLAPVYSVGRVNAYLARVQASQVGDRWHHSHWYANSGEGKCIACGNPASNSYGQYCHDCHHAAVEAGVIENQRMRRARLRQEQRLAQQ